MQEGASGCPTCFSVSFNARFAKKTQRIPPFAPSRGPFLAYRGSHPHLQYPSAIATQLQIAGGDGGPVPARQPPPTGRSPASCHSVPPPPAHIPRPGTPPDARSAPPDAYPWETAPRPQKRERQTPGAVQRRPNARPHRPKEMPTRHTHPGRLCTGSRPAIERSRPPAAATAQYDGAPSGFIAAVPSLFTDVSPGGGLAI